LLIERAVSRCGNARFLNGSLLNRNRPRFTRSSRCRCCKGKHPRFPPAQSQGCAQCAELADTGPRVVACSPTTRLSAPPDGLPRLLRPKRANPPRGGDAKPWTSVADSRWLPGCRSGKASAFPAIASAARCGFLLTRREPSMKRPRSLVLGTACAIAVTLSLVSFSGSQSHRSGMPVAAAAGGCGLEQAALCETFDAPAGT